MSFTYLAHVVVEILVVCRCVAQDWLLNIIHSMLWPPVLECRELFLPNFGDRNMTSPLTAGPPSPVFIYVQKVQVK